MSAEGLGPQLEHVHDAHPFRIDALRRFAKPSQRGGCLAMDVVIDVATVSGAVRSGSDAPGPSASSCEGLLLTVTDEGQAGLVRREGYAPECWDRIRDAAGRAGPAAFLLELAHQAGDGLIAYREALHEVAGASAFKASHYLPHPVRTDADPALIFVAPAIGATGIPGIDSAKAAHPDLSPRSIHDLFTLDDDDYPGFDPARQTWYAELCLRAAAHGIWIGDLVPNADREHPVAQLLAAWRADPSPLEAERARLIQIPALQGPQAYRQRFGDDLPAALSRSGLWR